MKKALTNSQAANIRGARTIIAIDRVQSRLDTAKAIGATHTINTTSFVDLKADIAKAIQDVEPEGPNVVVDTTGVVPIVETSFEVLHQRGQLVLIGIMAGKTLPLDLTALLGVRPPISRVISADNALGRQINSRLYRRKCKAIEGMCSERHSVEF